MKYIAQNEGYTVVCLNNIYLPIIPKDHHRNFRWRKKVIYIYFILLLLNFQNLGNIFNYKFNYTEIDEKFENKKN